MEKFLMFLRFIWGSFFIFLAYVCVRDFFSGEAEWPLMYIIFAVGTATNGVFHVFRLKTHPIPGWLIDGVGLAFSVIQYNMLH